METTLERTLASVTSPDRFPDPGKRWELTKRAMRLWLTVTGIKDSYYRHDVTVWVESLAAVTTETEYAERLETIRERIQRDWMRGVNCTPGTAQFCETFGLELPDGFRPAEEEEEEEEPQRQYVRVNVTVTFYVDNGNDVYETRRDVENYLRLEVAENSNVDNMDYESVGIDIDRVSVEYE